MTLALIGLVWLILIALVLAWFNGATRRRR